VKIKQLMLQNFRPFYGRHTLALTTTQDKPLVLIKANNDVGKTSVFMAIYFCLYGRLPERYKGSQREDLAKNVNRTARVKGNGRTFVKLIFEHKGKIYDITRSTDFHKAEPGELPEIESEGLDVYEGGEPQHFKDIEEYNDYIEAILPEDASQFFLFDGEDIQKYTQHPPTEDVRHAIEMVLGIRELLNAREDLEFIEQELSHDLNNILAKVAQRSTEAKAVQELGTQIDELHDKNKQLEKKIEDLQKVVTSCDEELMKDRAIQEKVSERTSKEQAKTRTRDSIKAINEEKRDFNRHMGVLLANPLMERLSEMGVSHVPDWKRTAISALLSWESERCICERELTEEIRKKFEELLDERFEERPTEFLGERAVQLLLKTEGKALERRFYELESRKAGLETDLATYEDAIEKMNKEIGDQIDLSADIRGKEATRKHAAEDLETCKRERDQNNGIILEKNASLERMRSKLVDEEQMNKDINLKSQHLESCKDSKSAINFAIESLVDETRREVQQLASNIFVDYLTNNPKLYRGIEITDHFELKIKTVGGTILPVWIQAPSAGQSQVIATSFIAALNKYAAREAPIVIDTPIGRLDPLHKSNLIKYYPKIGTQVLILYQPNELTDVDLEPIGKFVAAEWLMSRDATNPDATIISREE